MTMMKLSRRAPVTDPFDQMIQRFFRADMPSLDALVEEGTLALDVSENSKQVIVRASLPGFKKDDVHVELHDGVLAITAEHTEETSDENERFFRKERRVGSMSRRVALPGALKEDSADAKLEDGVLMLTVEKAVPETPRKISIS